MSNIAISQTAPRLLALKTIPEGGVVSVVVSIDLWACTAISQLDLELTALAPYVEGLVVPAVFVEVPKGFALCIDLPTYTASAEALLQVPEVSADDAAIFHPIETEQVVPSKVFVIVVHPAGTVGLVVEPSLKAQIQITSPISCPVGMVIVVPSTQAEPTYCIFQFNDSSERLCPVKVLDALCVPHCAVKDKSVATVRLQVVAAGAEAPPTHHACTGTVAPLTIIVPVHISVPVEPLERVCISISSCHILLVTPDPQVKVGLRQITVPETPPHLSLNINVGVPVVECDPEALYLNLLGTCI